MGDWILPLSVCLWANVLSVCLSIGYFYFLPLSKNLLPNCPLRCPRWTGIPCRVSPTLCFTHLEGIPSSWRTKNHKKLWVKETITIIKYTEPQRVRILFPFLFETHLFIGLTSGDHYEEDRTSTPKAAFPPHLPVPSPPPLTPVPQ